MEPERSTVGTTSLHHLVIRPAAAFRWNPIDDLVGIGYVASLAMNAIRGIDFQFRRTLFRHHFVDCRRAKILARIAVLANAAIAANVRLKHDQVARLIFLMTRPGVIDVR